MTVIGEAPSATLVWLNGGSVTIDSVELPAGEHRTYKWPHDDFPFRASVNVQSRTVYILGKQIPRKGPNALYQVDVATLMGGEIDTLRTVDIQEILGEVRNVGSVGDRSALIAGGGLYLMGNGRLDRISELQPEMAWLATDRMGRVAVSGKELPIKIFEKYHGSTEWRSFDIENSTDRLRLVRGEANRIYVYSSVGGLYGLTEDGDLVPVLMRGAPFDGAPPSGVLGIGGDDWFVWHSDLLARSVLVGPKGSIELPGAVFAIIDLPQIGSEKRD